MLRCREVTRLHASGELASSGLIERWGVRVHLLFCRHCRRYVRQLARIVEAAGALARGVPVPEEQVEAMLRRALTEGGRDAR